MPLSYNNQKVFLLKSNTYEDMVSIYFMEADSGLTLRMDVSAPKVPQDFF